MSAARAPWLHAAIAVAAVVLLAAGLLLQRAAWLVWPLVLLGASYALWLVLGTKALDQRIPVVGAGLLLVAELAFDSLEPEVGRPEATAVLGRAIVLTIVVLGAAGAGAIVVAAASIPLSGGVGLTALGAVAAVCALALIARLASLRR